jgi:hypothetical protein
VIHFESHSFSKSFKIKVEGTITKSKMSFTRLNKIFIVMGCMTVCAALGSYFFSQSLLKSQIHQNVYVLNNSKAYTFWVNPPARILRNYYLFSVQNPEEASRGAEKPRLVEMGPYTYSEVYNSRI